MENNVVFFFKKSSLWKYIVFQSIMIKASITLLVWLYFIFHSPPTILLFFQVILRQSLYLGGVPTFEMVSPFITVRESFSGCIQKVSFCILTTYCNILVLIKVSMKSRVTHCAYSFSMYFKIIFKRWFDIRTYTYALKTSKRIQTV